MADFTLQAEAWSRSLSVNRGQFPSSAQRRPLSARTGPPWPSFPGQTSSSLHLHARCVSLRVARAKPAQPFGSRQEEGGKETYCPGLVEVTSSPVHVRQSEGFASAPAGPRLNAK